MACVSFSARAVAAATRHGMRQVSPMITSFSYRRKSEVIASPIPLHLSCRGHDQHDLRQGSDQQSVADPEFCHGWSVGSAGNGDLTE